MTGEEQPAPSGSQQVRVALHAVVPLTTCPHLEEVRPIPNDGINALSICSECSSPEENWVCLTCYMAHCSRYVSGHAVIHRNTSGHPMAISLTDISVWCYACEAYVHNDILLPAKNEVHRSKFGDPIPISG
uniref:UBP-type domain-containing protein n=2 Tax=Ascaris TaxID=6251 RepID=A0A0M3I3E9_ASCLU